ncbi:2'-5' RNA ligase family protein [Corynebacterium sp.]|uniref:2'-5' RNA ligase family protein n=1 Tax=Corynebacterium sp. TaxID=1720 RepID=UPI0026E03AD9|nr:2'-5' RNA ligase family protein [Corynebacterium sp.]MDO5512134.1 2'-5' RNA ligase family protein [Corynebacterium sp.]
MRRFFGHPTTEWPSTSPRLHIYIDASPLSANPQVSAALSALTPLPWLGVQPPRALHATVHQLTEHTDDVDDEWYAEVDSRLRGVAAASAPFSLTFTPPQVGEFAVTVDDPKSGAFDELLGACRNVISSVSSTRTIPAAPPHGHVSLAYTISDGSRSRTAQALEAAIGTSHNSSLPVEEFHLVGVTQDRKNGWFLWEPIRTFRLTGGSTNN